METFIDSTTNDFLKKSKVYDLDYERNQNYSLSKENALKLLQKSLPPSFRNYIYEWDYNTVINFIPFGDSKKYGEEAMQKLMEELNIFELFEHKEGMAVHPYDDLLPKTSRDAINFYFFLKGCQKKEEEIERFREIYYYYIDEEAEEYDLLDSLFVFDDPTNQRLLDDHTRLNFYIGNFIEEKDIWKWIENIEKFIEELEGKNGIKSFDIGIIQEQNNHNVFNKRIDNLKKIISTESYRRKDNIFGFKKFNSSEEFNISLALKNVKTAFEYFTSLENKDLSASFSPPPINQIQTVLYNCNTQLDNLKLAIFNYKKGNSTDQSIKSKNNEIKVFDKYTNKKLTQKDGLIFQFLFDLSIRLSVLKDEIKQNEMFIEIRKYLSLDTFADKSKNTFSSIYKEISDKHIKDLK